MEFEPDIYIQLEVDKVESLRFRKVFHKSGSKGGVRSIEPPVPPTSADE
jgi:hypothetical protein